MLVSTRDQVSDPQDTVVSANGDAKLRHTMAVLEKLLAQSIYLRDLYRSARWQTAAIQYRRLHQLFDRHYKEQLHLVDVSLIGFEHWEEGAKYSRGTIFKEPGSPVRYVVTRRRPTC
jgi:hypothetical protein